MTRAMWSEWDGTCLTPRACLGMKKLSSYQEYLWYEEYWYPGYHEFVLGKQCKPLSPVWWENEQLYI